MTPLLAALLLLPLLIWILINKSTTSRNKQQQHHPPCPPTLPLLGNLHQPTSLPHRSLAALSKKHGPLMFLYLGQVPTLVVSSAEAAKEIMKTYDHITASRPSLKAADIILYGRQDMAFSPYGEHWRQMRKLCINHLLNTRIVQSSSCSYLKAVIKETPRLHPPAPLLVLRESMGHCRIQGHESARDTRIIVNAWAIGRDSRYWENQKNFSLRDFWQYSRLQR